MKFKVPVHMEFIKKIGSGAYGSVASFRDTRTDTKIAVKKISNAFEEVIDGKRILREVKLLRQLYHENIISILDMLPPESTDFTDIYIVTDLMETDLHRVIYSKQPLAEEHVQFFIHQTLRGLLYLHSVDIVHRDLKPPNLLVNKNCDLKICDFGLARVMDSVEPERDRTDYVVTRWYRAPEVVLTASEYTKAIDIWAVGCILCELIGRRPLFQGKDHIDQIKKIFSITGMNEEKLKWLPRGGAALQFLTEKFQSNDQVPWEKLFPNAGPDAITAMDRMLELDPEARITVENSLRLKFFALLFEEDDIEIDTRLAPVDWSFDDFVPTSHKLQNYIYCECVSMHPELLVRDRDLIAERPHLQELLAADKRI